MLVYDKIGATYAVTGRPDPRIGALIRAALSDARSVINIGAGAGSYEPSQTVLAVEPSPVMIRQRPDGAAHFDGGYRLLTAELGAPKAKGGAR